jgi:murein DD-endopeptidase MepM/ murein hydrolase activator NlpD
VTARGDVPENALKADGTVVSPNGADSSDPEGFGNHVVIRHPDGRFSWILHMLAGSLLVKPGQHVNAGEPLGRVGFSGDALFPHVHYMATNSESYPSRGMPAYFVASLRSHELPPRTLRLDTGDIIRAQENHCPGSAMP